MGILTGVDKLPFPSSSVQGRIGVPQGRLGGVGKLGRGAICDPSPGVAQASIAMAERPENRYLSVISFPWPNRGAADTAAATPDTS